MSTWTIFGFVAILTVPWFIPEIVEFARRSLLRRARGRGPVVTTARSLPLSSLEWVAHGQRARFDEQTIARDVTYLSWCRTCGAAVPADALSDEQECDDCEQGDVE